MKSKKIIKAFKLVRKYCKRHPGCDCEFLFYANGDHHCAVERLMSNAGWEAFQIGAKEVFK